MISSKTKIYKYKNQEKTEVLDEVIIEYKLKIFLNDELIIERFCLKNELENMVIGYLISEGYINSYEDLTTVKFKENSEYEGECICKVKNVSLKKEDIDKNFNISGNSISKLMKEFTNKSNLFKRTGGVHSCGIVKNDKIVYFTDDVGRQNALDKMIGYSSKNERELEEIIVLFSGRITSEVVEKIKQKNIKGIITKAAVTFNGQQKGKDKDLIIVGFARANSFNIYNGEDKII